MIRGSRRKEEFVQERNYLNWLGNQLHVKRWEDWYGITRKEIYRVGGRPLLVRYGESTMRALKSLCPEHEWCIWKFVSLPRGIWRDVQLQKEFFDSLAKEMKFEKLSDWYTITVDDVRRYGGGSIIHLHFNLSNTLSFLYPQHHWIPWKFHQVSKGFWDSTQNQAQLIKWLEHQLDLKNPEDWYRISRLQIKNLVPNTPLRKFRMERLLSLSYPLHRWDLNKIKHPWRASQRVLWQRISQIFPTSGLKEARFGFTF